ncbi:MAG: hypothetical protein WA755_13535 [Candidatus Acidiferrales bacterium]
MPRPPSADLREIRETISTLHEPEALIELCAIADTGIASGYFDDHEALAREAKTLSDSGRYDGVYMTANPVKRDVPELKRREKNRIHYNVSDRTKDDDIARRHWLIIDIDSEREPNTSATERQKDAALRCLGQLVEGLRQRHWPKPVTADSGNGFYAIYAVDQPNDEETKELFKWVTKAVSKLYSIASDVGGELVKVASIDVVTFNAARLIKLFGTCARKGPDVERTPHRLSCLLVTPHELQVVSRRQLEDLVRDVNHAEPKVRNYGARNQCAEVDEFLKWGGIAVKDVKTAADGTTKWILESCLFNSSHTNAPAVSLSSDGKFGFHCFHRSCENNHWKEFRHAVQQKKGETFRFAYDVYHQTSSGIFMRVTARNGDTMDKQLTNFNAQIVADVEETDGVNFRHQMKIESTLEGRTRSVVIPASEFKSMNWVLERLGSQAVIFPGQGTADHARAAIQLLSTDVKQRRLYMHTGWRRIRDEWCYLHGDGAIDRKGLDSSVAVKLPSCLAPFRLPEPPTGKRLKTAVRASLKILDIAPLSRMLPIYAAILRAVLTSSDFSVHLTGPTGTFKTSVAALGMQHFGAGFDSRHLPAAWSSTANSNAALQFILKDAVLVIDDFVPRGSHADVERLHRDADRIFRGQGNNAGRGRMSRDTSLRDPQPPRGLTLSTGEEIPAGESLRTRVWISEFSPGDVDKERLTECQYDARAGLYAEAMSAFLQWIASKYDEVRRRLRRLARIYTAKATREGEHARTPEITANLMAGFDIFLEFAEECKAMSASEAKDYLDDAWDSLLDASEAQSRGLATEEPAQRFLELIAAAITRGDAHLAHANLDADAKNVKGRTIGWYSSENEDEVWLDLNSAFAVAKELARQQGEPFGVRMRTLGNRLRDRRLLTDWGEHRNTVQRKVNGSYRWVLCVRKDTVLQSKRDDKEAGRTTLGLRCEDGQRSRSSRQ